jgi:hypothetical protein
MHPCVDGGEPGSRHYVNGAGERAPISRKAAIMLRRSREKDSRNRLFHD